MRRDSRRRRAALALAVLLAAALAQGCIIPRTAGKAVGGVVRGTGKAIGAVTDAATAPLK